MPSKSVEAPVTAEPGPGLYLVATPIGNLLDLTRRAVEVLERVDGVVAEDTRRTRELLSHLGISGKKLTSIDAHASAQSIRRVVERVARGERLAYATDAGMPGVSDPGCALVDACLSEGVDVVVVPGASAVTAAVALSGLVDGPFVFLGFLPRRGSARRKRIESIARSGDAVVLFESPARTRATLLELALACPGRRAFVGRELTKLHEETVRGTLEQLAERASWRGEIVVVLAPSPAASDRDERFEIAQASLRAAIECGASPARAARRLAEVTGLSRRSLYGRALELSRELDPGGESPRDDD